MFLKGREWRLGEITVRTILSIAAALLIGAMPATAQTPESWAGLVEVRARQLDAAYLLPGADFRPYTKVMLDEPQVAFRNNWQRNMNSGRAGARVTDAQAAEILALVSSNTTPIFAREFERAGFTIVDKPGPDVLRLRIGIINLVINAPDTMSAGRTRSYTANAGEATLIMEARDSMTRALLASVADRRATQGMGGQATRISNTSEFRQLASIWARASASGVVALKEASPVPDPLTPGQRLR